MACALTNVYWFNLDILPNWQTNDILLFQGTHHFGPIFYVTDRLSARSNERNPSRLQKDSYSINPSRPSTLITL